jgi:hypothetical protein
MAFFRFCPSDRRNRPSFSAQVSLSIFRLATGAMRAAPLNIALEDHEQHALQNRNVADGMYQL